PRMSCMKLLRALWHLVRACCLGRAALLAENLALRQQLAILHRTTPRPRLRWWDRCFWVWLSKWWPDWRSALLIVKPAIVLRWHRAGFRRFWTWISRRKSGRPMVPAAVRALIRQMSRDNPLWGAPRIQAELCLLGHKVAESTVAKYLLRPRKP